MAIKPLFPFHDNRNAAQGVASLSPQSDYIATVSLNATDSATPAALRTTAGNNVITIPAGATEMRIALHIDIATLTAAPVIDLWAADANGVITALYSKLGARQITFDGTPVNIATSLYYVPPTVPGTDANADLLLLGGMETIPLKGATQVIIRRTTAATGTSLTVSTLYVKLL